MTKDLRNKLVAWLEDEYTHEEAVEQILNAEIIDFSNEDGEVYKIIYDNGVFEFVEIIDGEVRN